MKKPSRAKEDADKQHGDDRWPVGSAADQDKKSECKATDTADLTPEEEVLLLHILVA